MADVSAVEIPKANISPKSRLAVSLFCLFLGPLGIHRFYVGKIGTGILMLFTFGGLGLWYLIDLVLAIAGLFKDKDGLSVKDWQI
jgi:TM2 domain-containing membrane protein YozV